ncbi:hypothetical protein, partial [Stenotrophomonas sp. YIM B06876]|uniref:hypothetical protein n=1 Tax=Stenotrophomonas sp. YIM B06876 TaxID=3060211 RepID=UPI0027391FEF
MKTPSRNGLAAAALGGLLVLLSSGCAVTSDGGYAYGAAPAVGIGLDYYDEPFGFDYGGWGPGYGVGPFHRGGDFHPRGGGNASGHAFRPAAPSRS